ncbi:hypothetical protein F2Q68_00020145 [Brassica cretica]|uniref:Uncharacterized protein n=1 Tax=Brassica cretica TaxID=69181 RepID=A0A8S9FW66_BRACR|nr:hypothetical protein F2Q68_00020145 [Brassica cretica]
MNMKSPITIRTNFLIGDPNITPTLIWTWAAENEIETSRCYSVTNGHEERVVVASPSRRTDTELNVYWKARETDGNGYPRRLLSYRNSYKTVPGGYWTA